MLLQELRCTFISISCNTVLREQLSNNTDSKYTATQQAQFSPDDDGVEIYETEQSTNNGRVTVAENGHAVKLSSKLVSNFFFFLLGPPTTY